MPGWAQRLSQGSHRAVTLVTGRCRSSMPLLTVRYSSDPGPLHRDWEIPVGLVSTPIHPGGRALGPRWRCNLRAPRHLLRRE